MAKKQSQQLDEEVQMTHSAIPFTGVAYSVICVDHMKQFRNFKIVALTIEDGIVVKQELSDNYANWETISRLEIITQSSVLNLNDHWEDGKALQKSCGLSLLHHSSS